MEPATSDVYMSMHHLAEEKRGSRTPVTVSYQDAGSGSAKRTEEASPSPSARMLPDVSRGGKVRDDAGLAKLQSLRALLCVVV